MKKHFGNVVDEKEGYEVLDCESCGFKHIMPYPSDEDRKAYYKEGFIKERPLYISRIDEDLEWWNLVYSDRYRNFEKLLQNKGQKKQALDIGCGLGHFLSCGNKLGWETLGIEPGYKASEYARGLGLDVLTASFGEVEIDKKFDVIHLSEVLEHVPEPGNILKGCLELMNPGAVMCIVVPNDYNPLQGLLKKNGFPPYWVAPKVHVNYFNYETMSGLVEKNGFEVILKEAMFPLEFFLLMGNNYVGSDEIGRACHKQRKNFDLSLEKGDMSGFRTRFYRFLAEEGVGRDCIIYAKKR